MKAMVLTHPGAELQCEQRSMPRPGAGEVLIRVHACGICHGDLVAQQGGFPFVPYPIVLGHEVTGVIEELGDGVKEYRKGDRVGMSALFSTCGMCRQCKAGSENLCAQWRWTGLMTDGGYEEYMVAPARSVVPIPPGLSDAESAPVMCAGLTIFSALRHCGFQRGQRVAVIGFGGLGQYGILYAKALGARVAVVSTTKEKEADALRLGAELFIVASKQPIAEALQGWDGGADVILATPPSIETINSSFAGLAPDGTLVALGFGPGSIVIDPLVLCLGRRRLMSSPAGSLSELREALEIAASHRFRPTIREFPLEQANEALHEIHSGHFGGRAVLRVAL